MRPTLIMLALAVLAVGWLLLAAWGDEAPREVANPHGSFKEECSLCHGAEAWTPAKVSSRFDHAKYGFELRGAHATATCTSCHATLEFKQEKTQCASCHDDVHRGELGADCARCHTARSFVDRAGMARAHQLTRFPLTGSHAVLDCESCHRPTAQGHLQFVNTQAECKDCHQADYRGAVEPNHEAGGFPLECAECHSTLAWANASFDHDRSRFPLTGGHRTASCAECHGGGVYAGTATDCAACHRDDYDRAAEPPHAGLPLDCTACHTTATWDGAVFDHARTDFPLTGAHRSVSCRD
jgi:hypothetical protein